MRALTSDPELIDYGSRFLRTVSFSYLAMAYSQMYLSSLRSMERARLCALISSAALVLTLAFDALVILALFPGRPKEAVTGVGLGTVAARGIELALCALHSRSSGGARIRGARRGELEGELFHDYLRYTLPVLGNYLIWGGAVIVGKELGRGEFRTAREAGYRINLYALVFGIAACLFIWTVRPLVFSLARLSPAAAADLEGMLMISALYCVAKSLNSTNIGGIFPAGGDPRFGFWTDAIVMWGITIPLSALAAFVWRWPPVWVYTAISLDEFIKLPIAMIRYRQYRWLRQITRQTAATNET